MRDFNVKTSSPDEDRLETVLHFVGDSFPRMFVINRLGREVDYVEVDGERYERVRECEIECDWHYMEEVLPFTHEDTWAYRCVSCEWQFRYDRGIKPDYCPNCGAKVKVGA